MLVEFGRGCLLIKLRNLGKEGKLMLKMKS
jgi:hypothetical protein